MEFVAVSQEARILIIGAGPTGLGAATRLIEHGHDNWLLMDAAEQAGGLSSSVVDDHGFTWDLGGHVLFSHYKWFDRLMTKALADAWIEHEREAWVWIRNRWVPYPFQNNLWRLPEPDIASALAGLEEVAATPPSLTPPGDFREWLTRSFGTGLCELFMHPYNRKVWAYDPSKLGVGWMGERVATVDLDRVKRNIEMGRDDVAWGPNATFRFPVHGGTGAIWRSLHDQLPADHVQLNRRVVAVNSGARHVRFEDGSIEPYDRLISTMPLDCLLRLLVDQPALRVLADQFVHSSSHIIGVGFEGSVPDDLRTKCWMYFPEENAPFYRSTVFSNYSPHNVARPGEQWSLMAEVSESPDKPVNAETIVEETIQGFRNCGMIGARDRIVTRWHRRLEHGYPTPWSGRDAVLQQIEPVLDAAGVYSRGRFGTWKYEVSNQDHSAAQGAEAVDHILINHPETTRFGRMDAEPPDVH
ncbi:MAG: FAD-dependent oxidoreductase [Gemmatimonas sp.]